MSKRIYSNERNPYPMFGIETEKGWNPIAQRVIDQIIEINDSLPEDSCIYIDQVKEKFAMLTVYVTYDNVPTETIEQVNKIINDAKKEAAETCELCGTKKNVGMRLNGWYTVMCEDCAKNEVKENFIYTKTGIKWKRKEDGKIFFISESGVTDYEEFEKPMKDGK